MENQQCQRSWRVFMALRSRGSGFSKDGGSSFRNWENLDTYLSAMVSSDKEFKMDALHQLSLLLLCMVPTPGSSFKCPDAHTISIHLGNKDILFKLQEITALHIMLFGEIAKARCWLFQSDCIMGDFRYDHNDVIIFMRVLQCCIRMLPLLEFDTGLSLVASESLSMILKRLCSPANFYVLNDGFIADANDVKEAWILDTLNDLSLPWILSMEASFKCLKACLTGDDSMNYFACQPTDRNGPGTMWSDICNEVNKVQLASSLLEVFMDELLLDSNLADSLWDDEIPDSGSAYTRQLKLVCKAAASHFFLSASRQDYFKAVCEMDAGKSLCLGMSLPAAVILWDLSLLSAPHLPVMFLVHVMHILKRLLEGAACLTLELTQETLLSLAGSILESAAHFYSGLHATKSSHVKCIETSYSHIFDDSFCFFTDGLGKMLHEMRGNSQWKAVLMKIRHKGNHVQGGLFTFGLLDLLMQRSSIKRDFSSTLLTISTLHLISRSLMLLVAEANKDVLGNDSQHANAALYIDHAKQVFKFCDLQDLEVVIEKLELDIHSLELFQRADDDTEHAFTFFIKKLYVGFNQGTPKALQRAYWDVLMSLIGLFNFIESRRKESKCASLCKVTEACPYNLRSKKKLVSSANQPDVQLDSSTILLTKKYQLKRNKIMMSRRLSNRKREEHYTSKRNADVSMEYQQNGARQTSCPRDGDAFINDMLKSAGTIDGECYEDLKDFIVCKDGRDYSMWLKSRYVRREKVHRRSYWKRLKARKALLSLLSLHRYENDEFMKNSWQ